jgi:glycerol-1-phosphate dehydrogenase [NAD(P)+]
VEEYIRELMTLADKCDCGNQHNSIPIEQIIVANGAFAEAAVFVKNKGFKHAFLIADKNTVKAAGEQLSHHLTEENIGFSVCLIQPDANNDVVADEKSLIQALLELPKEADVMIAVGAGTLHDIARFTSAKTGVPFISVPTAPSVDGFTSLGAPLIIRGVKTTFQMTAPMALFADLAVLKASPQKMIAAGFGDMLAKYTSLVDWKFGHLVKGEPYCPLVVKITREALESCIDNVEKISIGDEEGIQILIEALIKSGLAMLLFGQSHPASGGEHHLSHYWEMEFLQQNKPAVLHGAKVGVSTLLLADIYKKVFIEFITDPERIASLANHELEKNIIANSLEITALYNEIPSSSQLGGLLAKLGGATMPEQLGIDDDLVKRSLSESYKLRNRFTALKFLNEAADVPKIVSELS